MGDFIDPTLGQGVAQPQGKPVGSSTGRGDGSEGDGNPVGHEAVFSHGSPRRAGVVVRATVEHMGLAGETELTVNVKWPASTFCTPPCAKPTASAAAAQDSQHVPGNGPLAGIGALYGPSVEPAPLGSTGYTSSSADPASSGSTETPSREYPASPGKGKK
ncbi:MAG: hypothetical protein WBQ94_29110 [Terracidiphilus sp.]